MDEITHWMNIMFMKIDPRKIEIMLIHPQKVFIRIFIRGTFVGDQIPEVKNVAVMNNLT